MKETWFPGKLTTLDEAECRELLARQEIGRVAWCDTLGPVIQPVNYVVDEDGDIRFRVEARGALASRFEVVSIAWDPENPLSGNAATITDLSIHRSAGGRACAAE